MKQIVLLVFALLSLLGDVSAQTFVLKTAAQRSPPKYILLNNGSVGGIAVEVMRAIERIDPSLTFSGEQNYLPFTRIQALLASGELDVFVGLGEDEERRAKYHYVQPALYQTRDGIFVRSKDPIRISSLEDIKALPGHLVITSQATAQLKEILEQGLNVDSSARNAEASLRMLLGGRGRFLYSNEIAIFPIARQLGVADQIRMAYVHESEGRFIVTSRKIDPEALNRLRRAMDILKQSGELQRIVKRHIP